MKFKYYLILVVASLLLLNCGEKEVQEINLENAIFKASGNNPSWKLEIDSNKGIHFYSNSKVSKIKTSTSNQIEIMDVAATSFHAKTDSSTIRVEIFRKQCIDSKKRSEFNYEVRVKAKNNGDKDFTEFKGCGIFIPDKRLNGTWELSKFNHRIVETKNFPHGLPFILLNIDELKISGNSGCNNFSGTFSFVGMDILINKNG